MTMDGYRLDMDDGDGSGSGDGNQAKSSREMDVDMDMDMDTDNAGNDTTTAPTERIVKVSNDNAMNGIDSSTHSPVKSVHNSLSPRSPIRDSSTIWAALLANHPNVVSKTFETNDVWVHAGGDWVDQELNVLIWKHLQKFNNVLPRQYLRDVDQQQRLIPERPLLPKRIDDLERDYQWIPSSGLSTILRHLLRHYEESTGGNISSLFALARGTDLAQHITATTKNPTNAIAVPLTKTKNHTLKINSTHLALRFHELGAWKHHIPANLGSTYTSYAELFTCLGHSKDLFCLKFDQTGQIFITGGDDGLLKVWDSRTGWLLHSEKFDCVMNDFSFSADNTLLAAVDERTVKIFELETFKKINEFDVISWDDYSSRKRKIMAVKLSPSNDERNKYLVISTSMGQTLFYHWLPDQNQFHDQPFEFRSQVYKRDSIDTIAFNAFGTRVAFAGSTGYCFIFSFVGNDSLINGEPQPSTTTRSRRVEKEPSNMPVAPKILARLDNHRGEITNLSFSSDGNRVLTEGSDGVCYVSWQVKDREWRNVKLTVSDGNSQLPKSSSTSSSLLTAPESQEHLETSSTAMLHKPSTDSRKQQASDRPRYAIEGSCWSIDDQYVIVAFSDRQIRLFDPSSGDVLRTFGQQPSNPNYGHTRRIIFLLPHPVDARLVLSAGWDGKMILWDISTGLKCQEWMVDGKIRDGGWHPDGSMFSVTTSLGKFHIFGLAPLPPKSVRGSRLMAIEDGHGGMRNDGTAADNGNGEREGSVEDGMQTDEENTARTKTLEEQEVDEYVSVLKQLREPYDAPLEQFFVSEKRDEEGIATAPASAQGTPRNAQNANAPLPPPPPSASTANAIARRLGDEVPLENDAAPDLLCNSLCVAYPDEIQLRKPAYTYPGDEGLVNRVKQLTQGSYIEETKRYNRERFEYLVSGNVIHDVPSCEAENRELARIERSRRAKFYEIAAEVEDDAVNNRQFTYLDDVVEDVHAVQARAVAQVAPFIDEDYWDENYQNRNGQHGNANDEEDETSDDESTDESSNEDMTDDEDGGRRRFRRRNRGRPGVSAYSLIGQPSQRQRQREMQQQRIQATPTRASTRARHRPESYRDAFMDDVGNNNNGNESEEDEYYEAPARVQKPSTKRRRKTKAKQQQQQQQQQQQLQQQYRQKRPIGARLEPEPWITNRRRRCAPYLPQPTDHIAIVMPGYQEYMQLHRNVFDFQQSFTVENGTLPDRRVLFGRIETVDFNLMAVPKQPTVCYAYMEVSLLEDPSNPDSLRPDMDRLRETGIKICLPYHDSDMSEPILLLDHYLQAVEHTYQVGERVMVYFAGEDETYPGTVVEVDQEDDSGWKKYRVKWEETQNPNLFDEDSVNVVDEGDEMDAALLFSAWEVFKPRRMTIQHQQPPYLPSSIELDVTNKIVKIIDVFKRNVESLSFYFDPPVPFEFYPGYCQVIAFPTCFQDIIERLKHGYYRSVQSVVWEIEVIKYNAWTFNEDDSDVSMTAYKFLPKLEEAIRGVKDGGVAGGLYGEAFKAFLKRWEERLTRLVAGEEEGGEGSNGNGGGNQRSQRVERAEEEDEEVDVEEENDTETEMERRPTRSRGRGKRSYVEEEEELEEEEEEQEDDEEEEEDDEVYTSNNRRTTRRPVVARVIPTSSTNTTPARPQRTTTRGKRVISSSVSASPSSSPPPRRGSGAPTTTTTRSGRTVKRARLNDVHDSDFE